MVTMQDSTTSELKEEKGGQADTLVQRHEPEFSLSMDLHEGDERLVRTLLNLTPSEGLVYPYDPRAAELLAVAAGWSYAKPKTMKDVMAGRGFPFVDYVDIGNHAMLIDVNAFFVRSACGRIGIIVFRGTEPTNAIDWLTDASVRVRPFREIGSIHGGFGLSLATVWPSIAKLVAKAIKGETNGQMGALRPLEALYVTGHSLGAALAALGSAVIHGDSAYADWRKLFRGVYTFGQPMVGDLMFAETCEDRFGKSTFRHVFGNDIVPQVPPRSTGVFKHFGLEFRDRNDRWMKHDTPVEQALSAALSLPIGAADWLLRLFPATQWMRFPYSIEDHGCLHYIRVSRNSAEEPVYI